MLKIIQLFNTCAGLAALECGNARLDPACSNKSSVVQAEDYLLACQRYIELNPVRAGMVNDPGQYRWSSYRHNGLQMSDRRLTVHPLYPGLGPTTEARSAAYRELFRPQLDAAAAETIREALRLGMPLGEGRFAETVCQQLGIRRNTGQRGRPAKDKKAVPTALPGQTDFGF